MIGQQRLFSAEPDPAAGSLVAKPVSGPLIECRHGVVVSVSAAASETGCEILRRRGNAVDAAVATAFALAVSYPEAGNIGGGGFMLVYPAPGAGGEPVVIDYRETAPAAATSDMFITGHRSSHLLVGVPGTVRGLASAQKRFGRLSWKEVVLPAIKLATDGFEIDASLARSLNNVLRISAQFPELIRTFTKDRDSTGQSWHAGDRLVQKDLGRTLQLIADQGPDAFYRGSIADALVNEVRGGGGILTKADLAGYEAKVRPAIHGTYRGYDIYSTPPPSSGGIALVEMLNILENFDLRQQGRWDPRTLHLMVEAMRLAYADRACFLGDPDFVKTPEALTSKKYARQLADGIELTRATKSEDIAKEKNIALSGEHGQTTHFSVIDADGMAVSNTYTLEQMWGGRLVVKGKGFLLNNEMGDFNPRPGKSDRGGMIGTLPNQIEPGKRMLSSMTPTIVARNGRVALVTGSPGGRTIINTVACVTLNFLEFSMSPQQAINAPRMHQAWFPDKLLVEQALLHEHNAAVTALRQMGHVVDQNPSRLGDAHSIWVDLSGQYIGVADGRTSGMAVGF
jgi:gamma-glutamyltranspeptidase/glutathione hydrolase